ncbi:MAG: DUF2520 domain-containing protein [Chitinophagaceae bacterium]|nr:DUF2520 domain-containing protein [Chitinophagaceae bacterium]
MNITIIGSGNVATVLGRLLKNAGHAIGQVFNRYATHAASLAAELNAEAISTTDLIKKDADIYIVATSDDSLKTIKDWLPLYDKFLVHTAGSASINVFEGLTTNYGVLYPLQSIRKELPTPREIPFLIDGSTEENKLKLTALAKTISKNVAFADDAQRSKLHLAAVMTNNFSNHLYMLAEEYCKKENIDFKLLYPLLLETVTRLENNSPAETQTGPAVRNDLQTIQKQRDMLSAYPRLLSVYDVLTESIINYYSS